MYKESFKIILRMMVVIILYYVLDYLFENTVIIIILVLTAAVFVSYNSLFKNDFDYKLKTSCDVNSYLDKINRRLSNKDEFVYQTYLAFAYVYQGNYEEAKKSIELVDRNLLSGKQDLTDKYYGAALKVLFEEQDLDKYSIMLEEYRLLHQSEESELDFSFFEVPKYILEKDFLKAKELLLELIPSQPKRLYIYELEYYLALVFIELRNTEDAKAVLDFVISKRFNIIYIEKCKTLSESI